jgi:hypothetical protein
MSEKLDPFENMALSEDTVRSLNGELGKRLVWNKASGTYVEPKDAPVARNPKFKYAQLPVEGLGKLAAADEYMPLLVLLRLEELWFTRFKRNPVKLANFEVAGVKISRQRKTRALRKLETAGLVLVERELRKSPLVRLLWRPEQR